MKQNTNYPQRYLPPQTNENRFNDIGSFTNNLGFDYSGPDLESYPESEPESDLDYGYVDDDYNSNIKYNPPHTTHVNGYYRKDGTYVSGHDRHYSGVLVPHEVVADIAAVLDLHEEEVEDKIL